MRKFYLLFLFLGLFQNFIFGQLNFDISKVKGKRHLKSFQEISKDSTYEPIDITLSKHKFEIRLNVFYAPNGGFSKFILYSDGKEWSAIHWESDFLEIYDTTKNHYKKINHKNWDTVVNVLNSLDIFTLPNQQRLKKEVSVSDGTLCSIVYKVKNKFRKYNFDNPDIYFERYPETIEFKKFNEIVSTFYSAFKN